MCKGRCQLFLALLCAAGLAGCAADYRMTMVPRNSGNTYTGLLHGDGGGTGYAEVTIEGRVFKGPAVRMPGNDSITFSSTSITSHANVFVPGRPGASAFGAANGFGTSTTVHEGATVRALLTSSDNRALRCDFAGSPRGGAGTCVSDDQVIYDVILLRTN